MKTPKKTITYTQLGCNETMGETIGSHEHASCDSTAPDESSLHSSCSNSSIGVETRNNDPLIDSAPYVSILRQLDDNELENTSLLVNSSDIIVPTEENLSFDSTDSDDESNNKSSWHDTKHSSSISEKYTPSPSIQYEKIAVDPSMHPEQHEQQESFDRNDMIWLAVCFTGIMASFVSYGIVLEYATSGGRRLHELSFIFVSSVLGSVTAFIGRRLRNETPATIPSNRFVLLGAFSIGSTFCAIRALRYVIFPIQVLARSAKPVPVMLMGSVMGKRYPMLKYLYVALIVLGVAAFMGGGDIGKHDSADSGDSDDSDDRGSTSQQLTGVLLLLAALFFDGSTGAFEDKLMSVHRVEPFDLMLKFQLSKMILSALSILIFNQLGALVELVKGTGIVIIALGMCSAIGQVFIFITISKFGALTSSLMSLTRKATTLVASIVIYGHPVNGLQLVGLFIGMAGMGLNASNFGVNPVSTEGLRSQSIRCFAYSRRVILVSIGLLATIATAFLLSKSREGSGMVEVPLDENAQPCTYKQLYDTFGRASLDPMPESQCLDLSSRVLEISQDSILNFASLIPLGHGNQSGVFKVFLELANGEQCVAVYKTDLRNTNLCHDAWKHPAKSWGHTKTCISAHMRPHKTTMRAERTGALVFQAQQELGRHLRGLLPTWAIVPHYSSQDQRPHRLRWSPPRAVGVIEPFIALSSLFNDRINVATSARNVANTMLPAAQGVEFLNKLGFAHQDILFDGYKNVGLIETGNQTHAIIYDYGYIAVDEGRDSIPCDFGGSVCNICRESFFPFPKMAQPIQYDLINLRDITIDLLSLLPNQNEAADLVDSLQACRTISDLVGVLEKTARSTP